MKAGQNNKYYITITPGFCACLFGKGQLIWEYFFFSYFFKYSKNPANVFTDFCPSIITSIDGYLPLYHLFLIRPLFDARAEICKIFLLFFGVFEGKKKNSSEINWPLVRLLTTEIHVWKQKAFPMSIFFHNDIIHYEPSPDM